MFERIQGVLTLKAPVYRQIADDATGTSSAALIFIVSTFISQFFNNLVVAGEFHIGRAITGAIFGLLVGLVGWAATSFVLSFVAGMLGGKTNFQEMLRVTGYVAVFSLVSVVNIFAFIPGVACITGLLGFVVAILSLVGYLIGIREAAEFSTTNAFITALLAVVVYFIIVVLIGGAIITALTSLFFAVRSVG